MDLKSPADLHLLEVILAGTEYLTQDTYATQYSVLTYLPYSLSPSCLTMVKPEV